MGMGRYDECAVQVSHNSCLQSFTELGIIGGVVFPCYIFYDFWSLQRIGQNQVLDPLMKRLLPFLTAMIVAYAGGIFTLSRTYDVPTYTMLGLATAYLHIVPVYPPVERICNGGGLIVRSVGM